MSNDYREIYKGARIVRANASTETDLHEHPHYGSGYEEYPIDPAILQEAENYTFKDPLVLPIPRQARLPGRPTTNASARPVLLA